MVRKSTSSIVGQARKVKKLQPVHAMVASVQMPSLTCVGTTIAGFGSELQVSIASGRG
jgi:phosphoribosylcarboxyaminoimidazole (NCAIR) mutase